MRGSIVRTGVLCGTLLLLFGMVVPAHAVDGSPVIAKVGGRNVTLDQLEQRENTRLLNARNQYYLAQRDALHDLIDQLLLEQEAERQKVTVDQLLERDVYGKIKDPTEDQLEVYYEALDTTQPLSALRDKILEHIRQNRRAKARAAYVGKLRESSPPIVKLEPPTAEVAIADAPRRGPQDASVVLVEFADYQCPYCQRIEPTLENLRKQYPDKLAIVYKDLPLPNHPFAQKAAEAAHCAGAQGKFWEYHDALFTNQSNLDRRQLDNLAARLNLDTKQFGSCLDSGKEAAGVEKSFSQGQALGLTGTPSFFINNHFLSGADYATLDELIKSQLATNSKTAIVDP